MSNIKDIKLSTVGKDDYPELEGKLVKIDFIEKVVTGVVVGCNRSVGLTIVDLEDKDHYLLCFSGPVTPNGIPDALKNDLKHSGISYDAFFDYCIELIEKGGWTAGAMSNFARNSSEQDRASVCTGGFCAYK